MELISQIAFVIIFCLFTMTTVCQIVIMTNVHHGVKSNLVKKVLTKAPGYGVRPYNALIIDGIRIAIVYFVFDNAVLNVVMLVGYAAFINVVHSVSNNPECIAFCKKQLEG